MTDPRPHSFQQIGTVAGRVVEKLMRTDGRTPWHLVSGERATAVLDADGNTLFITTPPIAERIVVAINGAPATVQCSHCRVCVPVSALSDPNRCVDPNCPLNRKPE